MYMSGHGRPPEPPSVPEITFEDFVRALPQIRDRMNCFGPRLQAVCDVVRREFVTAVSESARASGGR